MIGKTEALNWIPEISIGLSTVRGKRGLGHQLVPIHLILEEGR
jgi:hypothetical protein